MFTYVKSNGVGYYYSTLLKSMHAFATRKGGVSESPYTSGLNLAFGRGDEDAVVLQNLRLLASAVGVDANRVISLPQVHGTEVLTVTSADAGRGYTKPANGTGDGYMTLDKGVPLGVKSADCVPVLLEARDADGRVLAVAAVHAGWRGTAGGIVVNAEEFTVRTQFSRNFNFFTFQSFCSIHRLLFLYIQFMLFCSFFGFHFIHCLAACSHSDTAFDEEVLSVTVSYFHHLAFFTGAFYILSQNYFHCCFLLYTNSLTFLPGWSVPSSVPGQVLLGSAPDSVQKDIHRWQHSI